MGQRLNLEIWNNGKVLANAYYHWSAYTSSAAKIVNEALASTEIFNGNGNEVLYAIRLLEATGAGLPTYEREYIQKNNLFEGCGFAECNGRNEGLIAISEEGIKETRDWEEGAARIYLDEKRISFNVFWKQHWYEWEKDQCDYGEEIVDHNTLQIVDFNFDDIKFDDWGIVYAFLKEAEEPFRVKTDVRYVLTPIC